MPLKNFTRAYFVLPLFCLFSLISSNTFGLIKFNSLRLQLQSNYDDNILNYSERDIDNFLNRLENHPSRITTIDDWKNETTLKTYFKGPKVLENYLEIRYFAKFTSFYRNPFCNYFSHTLFLDQKISSSFELHFKYFFMPQYYLREYYDRDLRVYKSCNFDLQQTRLGLSYAFSSKTQATLQAEYQQIYYNQYFTEFDSQGLLYELVLERKFFRDLRVLISAGYMEMDNIGYSPSQSNLSSPFTEDTEYGDGTYQEESYLAEVRYRIRNVWEEDIWFTLQYKLRHRVYTTDNSLTADPFHAGRMDDRQRISFTISRDIIPRLNAEVTYNFEWRDIESPEPVVEQIKDFQNNTFSLSLTYKIF